jgi:hypothetical protein
MIDDTLKVSIEKWKEQYHDVYYLVIGDKDHEFSWTFVFREIGREEYRHLLEQSMDVVDFQEKLCETVVLHPSSYDFSNGKAGVAEVLANAVMELSGLHTNQADQLLKQYREEMNVLDYQIDCLIHEAFPEFTLEEIQSWSVRKQMYYLSRAEWILTHLRGVPLVIDDQQKQPEAYQYHFEKGATSAVQNMNHPSPEEQEVLRMLAENEAKHGRTINWQGTNIHDEMFPELSWFTHEEELRGDFD